MKKEIAVLDVVVVGAGALGNEVVWNLGRRGVGRVLCVDPDTVSESNLGLARMFSSGSIGEAKATALVRAAGAEFPGTRWEAFDGEVADLGWGRMGDLIFGCVDRDSARLETARIATRLGIPVCDGGLGVCGRVSYFPGRPDAACFGCRLTAARRRELLSTWRSTAYPCVEPVSETSRASTEEQVRATGALQVSVGLAGGEAVTTEIRAAGERRFQMAVSEACPFHEVPERLVPYEPGLEVKWEWPICLRAICQDCGHAWSPKVRRARLHACPECGGRRILPLECVDRLEGVNPESIGLPRDHRYTVRVTGPANS